MNFFSLLKKEHKEAKASFKTLLSGSEIDREDAEVLCKKLLLHMELEETYYYPLMEKPKNTSEMTEEAELEHAEAKKIIKSLLKGDLDDVEYKVKLELLHLAIEHHVEEEEKELFPASEKQLSREEIEEITIRMSKLKEKKESAILAS